MLRNIKYCIIEDEYYTLLQLRETLAQLRPNYTLIDTADDCAGLMRCINLHPDLIIADVRISDGRSIDVMHACNCQVPVIFNTAYSDFQNQLQGLNKVDYLLKPASPEIIEQSLLNFEKNILCE